MSEFRRTRQAWRRSAGIRDAVLRVVIGLALGLTASCARERACDYAAYERIPIKPASKALRVVATVIPPVRKATFYGNYGGPGNFGGKPVDEMDELFRRHDIVYSLAKTRKTMVEADHSLVEGVSDLDPSNMNAEAVAYRDRVIRFFEAPISHVLGKPLSTLYTAHEPPGCYFQSPGVVREFFSKEHTGIPEVGRRLALEGTR